MKIIKIVHPIIQVDGQTDRQTDRCHDIVLREQVGL